MSANLILATRNSIDWSRSPGESIVSPQQWSALAQLVDMSSREIQIAKLLMSGLTRTEIALHLQISPRTVRFHMESLHDKLQVKSRVELVMRLVQLRDFLMTNQSLASK